MRPLCTAMYGAGAWQAVAVFLAKDNQNCLNI